VGPRARLDAVEKKISCHCRKSNTGSSIVQPVDQSLYRLSYPGSHRPWGPFWSHDFTERERDALEKFWNDSLLHVLRYKSCTKRHCYLGARNELSFFFGKSGYCNTESRTPLTAVHCCHLLLLFVTTINSDCQHTYERISSNKPFIQCEKIVRPLRRKSLTSLMFGSWRVGLVAESSSLYPNKS
jgi:hypothetical protein